MAQEVTRAGDIGPDPEGVAHEAIVKALQQVHEVNEWDDVFEMAADVAISALLGLPVPERMAAMGMKRLAWFQPHRQPGQRFWPGDYEPNAQWAEPLLPLYGEKDDRG